MPIVSMNTHFKRKRINSLLDTIAITGKKADCPQHKWRIASAALMAGFAVALSGQALAAEDTKSVNELQAENAKLRQELEAAKQQLNLSVPVNDTTENAREPAATAAQPAESQPKADESNVLGNVVVTSRNREEIAQDVPIPISILGGKQIDRDRVLTVDDLTRKAPGLTATTPNARRSGISIRGIGKSAGTENAEAAVGIVVDDVYLSQSGMSYQDYTDLDRIEVLRGPQGTLKGKNTTLGLINYVSRAPSFTPQGSVELEVGGSQGSYSSPGGGKAKASYSNAIIDDVLAWRGSFFVDKQDGDLNNINTEGGRWHEKNRYGGRLQFLWKVTENITAKLNMDAAFAKENSNTKPWIIDPTTFADGTPRTNTFTSRISRAYFNGYQPIIGKDNVDTVDLNGAKPLETNNRGISALVDWSLGPITLTSITAARRYHFDAKNDSEQTQFDIARTGTLVDAKQFSQEFRLTSELGGFYDYQTGLYFLKSKSDTTSRNLYGQDAGAFYASNGQFNTLFNSPTAAGLSLLRQSLNNVYATNTQVSETDSKAWFGQVNWHLTELATLTTGLRYTHENRQNSIIKENSFYDGSALTPVTAVGATAGELAAAEAIRAGQTGTAYGLRDGELTENSISWLLSPSYKLNNNVLLYASAAGGEKSSAVSFRANDGQQVEVNPEQSLDFELGFKSLLLNRRLLLNVNLYNTIVKDYQATTSTFVGVSPGNPTGYQSNFGNIPEITARGLELEGAFSATSNLTLNFGGAYNHAVYSDWKNATCPNEIVVTTANPTCDNTGKQIVGAPRYSGIFGAEYRVPLANGFTARAFFSTVVRSKQNLEAQLSEYGEVSGYSVTDGGIGIISGKKDKFEVNLVGKNIFDKRYTTSVNNFSNSAPVGWDGLGAFRYVGLVFRTNY